MVNAATRVATRLGHKLLSVGLRPDALRLKVAIWGTRDTGKTSSLAMLPVAAEATKWTMSPADSEATSFVEEAHEELFVNGRFPRPSSERGPKAYSFIVRRPRSYPEKVVGRRRSAEITFLDAPGAWCERPIPARLASPDSPIEYLVPCDAILFFFDPVRMRLEGSEFGAGIANVLDAVRRRLDLSRDGRLPHRIAFVVSKMDEDEQWPNRNRAQAYVMELLGMPAYNDIVERLRPSHYQFFACSAVGRIPGRSNCERFEGRNRIADPGKLQPYRLFEPVEWIVEGQS